MQKRMQDSKNNGKNINYHRTEMQKEMVIHRLREQGCRLTRQREILLDIILQNECSSCKEIYYKAVNADTKVGVATVYRMINTLEEIGAISRKNLYKISCCQDCGKENVCQIELDDHTFCNLSAQSWYRVISEGLKVCGYVKGQKVTNVMMDSCENVC